MPALGQQNKHFIINVQLQSYGCPLDMFTPVMFASCQHQEHTAHWETVVNTRAKINNTHYILFQYWSIIAYCLSWLSLPTTRVGCAFESWNLQYLVYFQFHKKIFASILISFYSAIQSPQTFYPNCKSGNNFKSFDNVNPSSENGRLKMYFTRNDIWKLMKGTEIWILSTIHWWILNR